MKNLLYIFLFFPLLSFTQVNMWTYDTANGGNNNGTIEQSEAQAALDAESNLIVSPAATITLSSRLDVDTQSGQIIDWNGSTITTNTTLNPLVRTDKRTSNGGTTTMIDLSIDGNGVGHTGMEIYSRVDFTNVDVFDLDQGASASSPAGFQVEINNDADAFGTYTFDGCDINDLYATNNDNLIDAIGAANGFLLYWNTVPSTATTITFKNATIERCMGEDAQNAAVFSPGIDVSYSSSQMRFENVTFGDWERRSLKLFSGNNYLLNCTVNNVLQANVTGTQPAAGMVAIGEGSGSTGGDNNVFEGCNFVGLTSGGRTTWGNAVIAIATTDLSFNNCTWSQGADLAFTTDIGDVYVCSATFGAGSDIYEYNTGTDYGSVFLDTDNVYTDGIGATVDLTVFEYTETDLSCPPPDLSAGITIRPGGKNIRLGSGYGKVIIE